MEGQGGGGAQGVANPPKTAFISDVHSVLLSLALWAHGIKLNKLVQRVKV
jgi:hypothetical protein